MKIQEYLVTLGIRPSDLSGLKELPGPSKDRLTPLFLLAPWLATVPLSRAMNKISDAYPDRPYLIDVDPYYRILKNPNEAKEDWKKLSASPPDLALWFKLLMDYPHAHPCLLMKGMSLEGALYQVRWARANDRNFCIRVNFAEGSGSGMPPWMPSLLKTLADEGANDFSVVLEFGWVADPLQVAAMAGGYVKTFFSVLSQDVPIAVSCTSFPKDFTVFKGVEPCPFSNRSLTEQIKRETNLPNIVYSDWGTTRPRSYGHASTPKRRVDYPTDNSWIIVRGEGEEVEFEAAAKKIMSSQYWRGDLGIWGEQLIEGAAAGEQFAIDTMPKMYAARINIHLHQQAFYGHMPPPVELDEEWVDL